MKHLALLFSLIVMLFLVSMPLAAQDTTEPSEAVPTVEGPTVINVEEGGNVTVEATDTPAAAPDPATNAFVYIAYVSITLIVIAVLFNIPTILKIVAPLVPLESALQIAKGATPTVADAVLNNVAAKTPTVIDDQILILALQQRGYAVSRDASGVYHTAPSTSEWPAPPSGSAG